MNLEELLESERTRPGFTGEERAAMWRGIERSVAGAAAAGAAGGAAATAAKATAASSSAASSFATSTVTLAKWKVAGLLSAVALGAAGAGAAAHARFAAPKIVEVERATPAVTAVSVSEPAPSSTASLETAAATPAAAPARPTGARSARSGASQAPAPAAAKDPALARERTLLDMARTALSRSDPSGALASLDTHAREFPSSQLAEEREVLAIQALASAGRTADARKRAAAFRARFVNSSLLPIVDEATQ